MDDFWNTSETAPSTLDDFFDEESQVNWTGSKDDFKTYLSVPLSSSPSVPSVTDAKEKRSPSQVLGQKIDSWIPSPISVKLKNNITENGSCLHCRTKDEEITQLKWRLERAYSRHTVTLPPEDTVKRILLGLPYTLESYKMLKDKISLLEVAVATMDASTILAILIFMKKTTNKSFFIKELQKHPLASQIYISYQKQRLDNTEVLDILELLGKMEEAAMFRYELAISSLNDSGEESVKSLCDLSETCFSDPALSFQSKLIQAHRELIELQIPIDEVDSKDTNNPMLLEHPRASSLLGRPLLTTLYYCALYHWGASKNLPSSPLYLMKHFNIPSKQFLWTVIKARAKMKHWPLPADLENLLASKSLMGSLSCAISEVTGGGNMIVKKSLNLESVVDTLASTGAPANVLAAYIKLLGSNNDKLRVGLMHKCHLAVVKVYIAQKDRDNLEKYLKEMSPGTSEYVEAEQALRNTKWKS